MRPTSLEQVVRAGLCSGCGLCAALAGPDALRMVMTEAGFERPRLLSDGIDQRPLLAVCPGAGVTLPPPERQARQHVVWGPHRLIGKAHAKDEALRFRAASGGVLTALAQHLLNSGAVEGVLQIGVPAAFPMRAEARVSRDAATVLENAGARYGPAAPLSALMTLVERGRRFAVIGKPCDIAAVKALAARDPRVAEQLGMTLSFLCGGVPSLAISRRIVGGYGLREEDVALLRYRGNGCPGPTHIETRDGRVFEQSYDTTWGDALNQDIQFRCKICADAIGLAADLVAGDAWITSDGYARGDYEGWNAVIARSTRGEALLRDAVAAGALHFEPQPLQSLARMQPHHVERRQSVPARLLALALARQPAPRFRGAGLLRAAWRGRRAFLANLRGTLRRVRQGRNREPLP